MRVFFSGCARSDTEADPRLGSPRYRLFSCHDDYYKYAMSTIPLCASIDTDFEIMLDSGAFTAWTKGDEISLDHLIKLYGSVIDTYSNICDQFWLINLDVIPGRKGSVPTKEQIDQALIDSDKNYERLVKEFGDIVLPVYHMTEPQGRLQEVCDMSAGYVLISPRNDWSERERIPWAKQVHKDLPDGIRTHGLGATGLNMMTEVPWHSVDSTSWLMSAMYGNIWVPGGQKIIGISTDNPALKNKMGGHYQHLTESERSVIDAYAAKHDFDLDEMSVDYGPRCVWNRMVQSDVYRAIPEGGKATPEQDTLFGVY